MTDIDPLPVPARSAGVRVSASKIEIATLITLVGALFAIGQWKGGVDEKVTTFGGRLDKHEERLIQVEAKADTAVRATEFILKSLEEFRGETKAHFETEHTENKSRFDRQMERLDKISEHQTAPPAGR